MTNARTRLAPSPTGALHLGNICTFLLNWAIARQKNWEIVLRVEDIDGPRKKLESIEQSLDILKWVGIDWDGEVTIQSETLGPSQEMLASLIQRDLAYHCSLSRSELEHVQSAPHLESMECTPSYRPSNISKHNEHHSTESTNWRFVTDHSPQTIYDELLGIQEFTTEQDFVVWTKNNMPSYQLAVVADDHRQGITHVVRGNDLLQSAAWQEQLYNAMSWDKPTLIHLPMVVGPDGRRLAKRHGDSRISTYRTHNVSQDRIIGLIAMWTNTQSNREPMTINEFTTAFDLSNLNSQNIVFSEKDEAWLFA